jgi:sugar lactone lactonase YvrE
MLELQLALYLIDTLNARIAASRLDPDRGDVAEKIVIVGVFVALAIAVGALITKAVTTDAHNVGNVISNQQV